MLSSNSAQITSYTARHIWPVTSFVLVLHWRAWKPTINLHIFLRSFVRSFRMTIQCVRAFLSGRIALIVNYRGFRGSARRACSPQSCFRSGEILIIFLQFSCSPRSTPSQSPFGSRVAPRNDLNYAVGQAKLVHGEQRRKQWLGERRLSPPPARRQRSIGCRPSFNVCYFEFL